MLYSAAMGSVRRATWRQYLPFLGLNVLVSGFTVVLVLAIWDRSPKLPKLPPTPTFDISARLVSAIPTATATLLPSPTPVTYTVRPGDSLGAIAAELDIPMENLMAASEIEGQTERQAHAEAVAAFEKEKKKFVEFEL